MQIESVQLGLPRRVLWDGREVSTGIFKSAVEGPVRVNAENLTGDAQADLRVHGGPDKSVYAYPLEHYTYWRETLPRTDWEAGLFGENLTTTGLLETDVRVGDVFSMGTAQLMAVQPRMPCFKLGIRFDDPGMVRRFVQAGRPGIYFRVVQEGFLQAGDTIQLVTPSAHPTTIQAVADNYYRVGQPDLVQTFLENPFLPVTLQTHFRQLLAR